MASHVEENQKYWEFDFYFLFFVDQKVNLIYI